MHHHHTPLEDRGAGAFRGEGQSGRAKATIVSPGLLPSSWWPTGFGNWLSRQVPPIAPSGAWNFRDISSVIWFNQSENAIVYEVDAGDGGLTNIIGNFSVSNGISVWVNGVHKFAAVAG